MSFVTLPAEKLRLSLQSGGNTCSAMCFTHLRHNSNNNNNNNNDNIGNGNKKTSAKAEALIQHGEASQRDALFSCLGWFSNNQLSKRHIIEVVQIRNTELGSLNASPFSEATIRLDEQLFASSGSMNKDVVDEEEESANGFFVHSLVPCYSAPTNSKTSNDNSLHDPNNNKTVFAIACVISARGTNNNNNNNTTSNTDNNIKQTTKAGVIFLVPRRSNENDESNPINNSNSNSKQFAEICANKESSFKSWLKFSCEEEARKILSRSGGSSAALRNQNNTNNNALIVDVSSFIPLDNNNSNNVVNEKSSLSNTNNNKSSVVSVKDATGTSEDVTIWCSTFSALFVGCENGKIFVVSPSSGPSSNPVLILNDETAGAVLQIAENYAAANNNNNNNTATCSFTISCINKCFILEIQMKKTGSTAFSFSVVSNKPVGSKARVGVYGGCNLAPLKEITDSSSSPSPPNSLPPTQLRTDASLTLVLRPSLRMFLADTVSGAVKSTLLLPAAPRVPGVRSLRDITRIVDRRIFVAGGAGSASAAPAPSCLALCVARNQVSLLDVFGLKYVAVQQITAEVLTSLQEEASMNPSSSSSMDEYGNGGNGGGMESSRMTSSRTNTGDEGSARNVTGRGGAGNAVNALEQALLAKGPFNIKSVQIIMGVFIVILLRNGEVNVVSMGKVTREFCEALMMKTDENEDLSASLNKEKEVEKLKRQEEEEELEKKKKQQQEQKEKDEAAAAIALAAAEAERLRIEAAEKERQERCEQEKREKEEQEAIRLRQEEVERERLRHEADEKEREKERIELEERRKKQQQEEAEAEKEKQRLKAQRELEEEQERIRLQKAREEREKSEREEQERLQREKDEAERLRLLEEERQRLSAMEADNAERERKMREAEEEIRRKQQLKRDQDEAEAQRKRKEREEKEAAEAAAKAKVAAERREKEEAAERLRKQKEKEEREEKERQDATERERVRKEQRDREEAERRERLEKDKKEREEKEKRDREEREAVERAAVEEVERKRKQKEEADKRAAMAAALLEKERKRREEHEAAAKQKAEEEAAAKAAAEAEAERVRKEKEEADEKERERLAKKDDIETFIEKMEFELLQIYTGNNNNSASSKNINNNGGTQLVAIEEKIMSKKDFFSNLLHIIIRLCARVKGLNQFQHQNRNEFHHNQQHSSSSVPTVDCEENNHSKQEEIHARVSHTIKLCRRFAKLLPELFRFAQNELSKPLGDRRLDSNLFLKDEVKRKISALVIAPLCFFEFSSLSDSFRATFTCVSTTSSNTNKNNNNEDVDEENNASSSLGEPKTRPNTFAQAESAQDIAFASATRATFKLLRTLKLMTWPLAAVLIYLLHRRRSLSMSVELMDAFASLSGAVGSVPPKSSATQHQTQPENSSSTSLPGRSSSNAAVAAPTPVSIAGEYLRKKPLPGSEPLITRSAKHHPLPHLLSAAMMIARCVVTPSVPFFGATTIDEQEDAISASASTTTTSHQNDPGINMSTASLVSVSATWPSNNAVYNPIPPPKLHATASTGAQIDFENLTKNVERCIMTGDGRISDFFPALPDVFTRATANSKSSVTISRNAKAVSQAGGKHVSGGGATGVSMMFYEDYGDETNNNNNSNNNSSGSGSYYDDESQTSPSSLDHDELERQQRSPIKSAVNIFEACFCDPDAIFVDYSVHTLLTLVYLPFINVVLPTKGTIAAWTQLAWDATFDQQWIEWAVTCPRLREDIYYYFTKKLGMGSSSSSINDNTKGSFGNDVSSSSILSNSTLPPIQKRLPSGMTMSALLCDQILPYLVQLRGDPRANLCLSPILRGGVTGLSPQEKQSSARTINHWEIDIVLTRRFCWCIHVFMFEYASIISKLNHEIQKNAAALAAHLASAGNNNNNNTNSNNIRQSERYALGEAPSLRDSVASTAMLANPHLRKPSSSSSSSSPAEKIPQSQLTLQRRLRQTDAWIEELITSVKTFFPSSSSSSSSSTGGGAISDYYASSSLTAYGEVAAVHSARSNFSSLLRGLAELACAFNHGRALVDLEGFNSVVDRLVAVGDVGALFPIIQYMGESHLTSREWSYILLVSKGAGLLRDAVHLALAVQTEQGPSGVRNVKNLVIQAFPSLRFGHNAASGDPQLSDALDMLQKLGA